MRPDVPAGPHRPGALPNLIVAGYGKCGTSSVHRYLHRHPEIAMSRTKEVGFFCERPDPEMIARMPEQADRALVEVSRGNWRRGLDWYRTHFDPDSRWRGESTPAYSLPWYATAAERLGSTLADVRIVLCVRDPVERALSRYRFSRLRGRERRTEIDAITHPDGFYAQACAYSPAWERLAATVGPERIWIIETEWLAADPAGTMNEVFAWLGLEAGLGAAEFSERWNETSAFATPAQRGMERLRRLPGWGHVAERMPERFRHRWQRLLGIGRRSERANPELREGFAELLAPDARRFRSLTDRSFSRWSI